MRHLSMSMHSPMRAPCAPLLQKQACFCLAQVLNMEEGGAFTVSSAEDILSAL